MQVTIEIPDDLAGRLEGEREHLAEIIERGLRRNGSEAASLAREVFSFLANEPRPDEILAFRPSERFVDRAR